MLLHLRCAILLAGIRALLGRPLPLPSHLMGPFTRKSHVMYDSIMYLLCGGWVHADPAQGTHALTIGRSTHLQPINASRHARQGRIACLRERWGPSGNAVLPIAGARDATWRKDRCWCSSCHQAGMRGLGFGCLTAGAGPQRWSHRLNSCSHPRFDRGQIDLLTCRCKSGH